MRSGGASGLLQGGEVFEGSSPVSAGQILVELVLEGLEAVTIGGAGAEAGDVQAWGVRQVDDEGLRQHQQLVFLGVGHVDSRCLGWGEMAALGNGEQIYSIAAKSQSQGRRQTALVLQRGGMPSSAA